MLNRYDQRVIIMAAGLWFLVLTTGSSLADKSQVHAKSKALAHYIMAVVNDLNGDDQQAIKEYEKTAKYDRREPIPHLRLGAYYSRLGRLAEATKQLKIVITLQPNLSQAHYLLALVYSSQRKYELAASEYETILKIADKDNSNNVDVHAYLGQLYFALRKYLQAEIQLAKVLEFQPKNVSALYLEGNIYSELNQTEKAKEDFRKVLSIEPEHDGSLNSLAYIYAEEGTNLDDALKMAKRAVELDPSNGAYYDTLGWVLFKQGFNAEGLMALEKAKKYVTDPLLYEHMGDVYKASNEPTLARKFWLKSLALDPKQIKVSQKIEQLNKTSAHNQGVQYNSSK